MNEKEFDYRNHTGTYQTGRTQPPKHYQGVLAFLIGLVILLSGISTALSIMNLKLYWKLNTVEPAPKVAFSRAEDVPQPTEAVHEEVRELQEHLGITGTVIPAVYQRYYKLPNGIYVSRVADRSKAQEQGLVAGDIIISLDGFPIHDGKNVDDWAEDKAVGDLVELTLYRAGTTVNVTLVWREFD